MRKEIFVPGEFYHVYNRGVDKRNIVMDPHDSARFLQSMIEFNTVDPIGSLHENSFEGVKIKRKSSKPLVNIVCFCLNPNHFHLLLEEIADKGISAFMLRMAGYTTYFNKRHNRTGALFQGTFKARHINSNEYLLRVSAYINLNNRVHQLGALGAKLVRSSWTEYCSPKQIPVICKKDVVLKQFKDPKDYESFALDTLPLMIEQKRTQKDLAAILFDE